MWSLQIGKEGNKIKILEEIMTKTVPDPRNAKNPKDKNNKEITLRCTITNCL